MNRKARCILGVIFGMLAGLAYGVISLWINSIFLPGVPLYTPPPGRFATLFIEMLAGGALGFLATWPEEFLLGVLISSVTGTIVASLISLLSQPGGLDSILSALTVLFLTFLPRIFIFLPVVLLVRWVVYMWEQETLYNAYSLRKRSRSVLLLVVICLAVGLFSLYPGDNRKSLKNLNALILTGRQASSLSNLPQPLRRVNGFLNYSASPYSLQILLDPQVIPVPQSASGYGQNEIAIEVLFSNGFRFGCIYTSPGEQPNCVDY